MTSHKTMTINWRKEGVSWTSYNNIIKRQKSMKMFNYMKHFNLYTNISQEINMTQTAKEISNKT